MRDDDDDDADTVDAAEARIEVIYHFLRHLPFDQRDAFVEEASLRSLARPRQYEVESLGFINRSEALTPKQKDLYSYLFHHLPWDVDISNLWKLDWIQLHGKAPAVVCDIQLIGRKLRISKGCASVILADLKTSGAIRVEPLWFEENSVPKYVITFPNPDTISDFLNSSAPDSWKIKHPDSDWEGQMMYGSKWDLDADGPYRFPDLDDVGDAHD